MKCSKCKQNERHGSTAYCHSCYAEYMKAYREAKKGNMEKPVMIERIEPIEELVEPKKEESKPKASPILWSYYIEKGSELHSLMLKVEAGMTNPNILSQIQAIASSPFKGQARA